MAFLIAQIAGGLSTVTALLCVQAKEAKMILLGQFICNLLSAACYGLLGSFSGAWVCILATIHTLLISLVNRNEPTKRQKRVRIISVLFSRKPICFRF